jgi:hypothetical protein
MCRYWSHVSQVQSKAESVARGLRRASDVWFMLAFNCNKLEGIFIIVVIWLFSLGIKLSSALLALSSAVRLQNDLSALCTVLLDYAKQLSYHMIE